MSSIIEKNKLENPNRQQSNSGSTPTAATAKNTTQTLRNGQDNNNTRESGGSKRTRKRRPTKIGLNDTLRRIRHLIVEGRSNLEIQQILDLEERTFYRYMAKIYEKDQALFEKQERKTITTEIGLFKDRLLKSYMWYNAMADNENMKAEIRMEAKRVAFEVARAVVKLEREGPKVIEEEGQRLVKKLYQNSK